MGTAGVLASWLGLKRPGVLRETRGGCRCPDPTVVSFSGDLFDPFLGGGRQGEKPLTLSSGTPPVSPLSHQCQLVTLFFISRDSEVMGWFLATQQDTFPWSPQALPLACTLTSWGRAAWLWSGWQCSAGGILHPSAPACSVVGQRIQRGSQPSSHTKPVFRDGLFPSARRASVGQ